MYVDRGHRRRGVARLIMDTIHSWCRDAGVLSLGLNASDAGRPLYESIGYRESPAPMMFVQLSAR